MGHIMHYKHMIIIFQLDYSIPFVRQKKIKSKYLITCQYIYTKLDMQWEDKDGKVKSNPQNPFWKNLFKYFSMCQLFMDYEK